MADLDSLNRLTGAYDSQVHAIRQQITAFGQAYWDSLPHYRTSAVGDMIQRSPQSDRRPAPHSRPDPRIPRPVRPRARLEGRSPVHRPGRDTRRSRRRPARRLPSPSRRRVHRARGWQTLCRRLRLRATAAHAVDRWGHAAGEGACVSSVDAGLPGGGAVLSACPHGARTAPCVWSRRRSAITVVTCCRFTRGVTAMCNLFLRAWRSIR